MKTIKIIGFVRDGKLSQRDRIKKAIQSMEGKEVVVTIEQRFENRTRLQNSFYWVEIVPFVGSLISEQWGFTITKNETHEILKTQCGLDHIADGEKTTKTLNTNQWEEFQKRINNFCLDFFTCEIPTNNG